MPLSNNKGERCAIIFDSKCECSAVMCGTTSEKNQSKILSEIIRNI